jgi:S-sulfo-L-cysteine synthase (O-acetyl-L-serine-dependent)
MSPLLSADLGRVSPLFDLVGRTPLIRLGRIERDYAGLELYGKAEFHNPGGSVKDRPARRMLLEGLASGQLYPGKVLLDATSGNTGIAYAMFGAALGYPVSLCVPENVTAERKRMLKAYGADLVLTDPLEGSDGAIREARRRYLADPERYFYPDQYNNDFNWRAHYDSTAPEILEQTGGRLTHFVAGLGTSGTFMGVGRRLREEDPDVVLASVQPDAPLHGLEGLKHMESAIVPGDLRPGAGRRGPSRGHRGGVRDDAAPRPRGGPARRHLVGRQRRGGHARGASAGGGGDDSLRHRRSLPVGAILGGA